MTLTRRRWLFFVLAVAIIGVAAASIRAVRERILSAAGWALVSDAPAEPADVIIVAVDAGRAGVLEASDLVHSGISTRVAVFSDECCGKIRAAASLAWRHVDRADSQNRGWNRGRRSCTSCLVRPAPISVDHRGEHVRSLAPLEPCASPVHEWAKHQGHGTGGKILGIRSPSMVGDSQRYPNRDCRAREAAARRPAVPVQLK